MTALEFKLIHALVGMIRQNCSQCKTREDVYQANFLSLHKEALMLLVELGVMEEMYPEEKFGERWERLFYAKFKTGWELEILDRKRN